MSKVLNVFYGADLLPYKDKELQVHFPIVGQAFQGSSQTNTIKFYIDNIGDEDTTWVAVAKLPNGQIGFKQLSVYTDSNGNYAYLQLSNWFTQYKGDLYINLQGYDGGIEFVEDEETHILTPVGDPIIEVTGSVKLTISYATQIVDGGEMEVHTLQEFWAALGTKLNKSSRHYFKVVDNITSINTLPSYADYLVNGDVVYSLDQKNFYSLSGTFGTFVATPIDLELHDLIVRYLTASQVTSGTIIVPNPEDITFGATSQTLVTWVDNKLKIYVGITNSTTTLTNDQLALLNSNHSVGIYNYSNGKYYRYICEQDGLEKYARVDLRDIVDNESMTINNDNVFFHYRTGVVTFKNTSIEVSDTSVIYSKVEETTGHEVRVSIDSNYDLKVELLNANNEVISSSDIDLPLESIVVSADYYDTYEYQGETYNQVIVITLATTDVPTIIPVGDLVSGLVDTTTFNNALDRKLDKMTTSSLTPYVYAYFGNIQGSIQTDNEEGKVVRRDTNGQIEVPSTPSGNTKAASKGYVDTAITNSLSTKQDTLVSGTNIKTINGTTLLGSGNYAFDSAFSEVSTNALENKVISKEIREINYELAIIRESLFESVLTEIDYEVEFATLYAIPDTLSDSDGTHRVVYSETELKEIEGNSFVYNQLCKNNASTDTINGVTFTNNGDGSWTINGTASDEINKRLTAATSDLYLNANHKYLIFGCKGGSASTYGIYSSVSTGSFNYDTPTLFTQSNDSNSIIFINVKSGTVINNLKIIPQIIDLTQSGIDSVSTVDEAITELAKRGVDVSVYNSYNTGEIRNSFVSGLKIRGLNQWDEEWELGNIPSATGIKGQGTRVVSKNYISVLPNTSYYFKFPLYATSGSWRLGVYQYRKDFSYISGITEFKSSNGTITTNKECYYLLILLNDDYGSTYDNDICINISSSLNGTYKPYQESTINITPAQTLLSAGSVHNYLEVVEGNVVEGEQLYNIVYNNVVNSFNLSSLNWSYTSGTNANFYVQLSSDYVGTDSGKANALCDKYIIAPYSSIASQPDKTIQIRANRYLYLKDSSLTSSDAPSGTIQVELATPVQLPIMADLHFDEVSSLIEQGGTIELIGTGTPANITTTFVVKKAVGE